MKTLLQVYEKLRDQAFKAGDGFGYLFWCSRVTETLSLMEASKPFIAEDVKELEKSVDTEENVD